MVRKLPVAIVISMSSHAAAIAWVVDEPDRFTVHREVAPQPAAPAPAPEPLVVVLLDADREPAAAPRVPDRAEGARILRRPAAPGRAGNAETPPAPGGAAISTDRPGNPETAPGRPGRARWMSMRSGERPPIELSPEFVADFLAHSKPVPPPPDIPFERLANEIRDLRQQMRHAGALGHQDEVEALRSEIAERNKQLAAEELKPSGRGTYTADAETFTARVDADGGVHLEDKPGKLDPQDRIMLAHGIDPYARDKLAMLDRTRDQRVAVGERRRSALLGRAGELMRENIDRLWAMTTDVAERKTGLFELWDDCAETGSAELVAAASAARLLVIGAIRAWLRGRNAYTAAELAQLNARRRSSAVFAPYEPDRR
ncbi:MAG TPA: hypothetical protein VGD80_25525 [Kofleriaceae bacterium]